MRKYRYISFPDRKSIAAWYERGDRPADIADRLGVTAKTVYSELKRGETTDDDGAVILDRNQRPAYNPVIAQQRVQESFRRRGRGAANADSAGA